MNKKKGMYYTCKYSLLLNMPRKYHVVHLFLTKMIWSFSWRPPNYFPSNTNSSVSMSPCPPSKGPSYKFRYSFQIWLAWGSSMILFLSHLLQSPPLILAKQTIHFPTSNLSMASGSETLKQTELREDYNWLKQDKLWHLQLHRD